MGKGRHRELESGFVKVGGKLKGGDMAGLLVLDLRGCSGFERQDTPSQLFHGHRPREGASFPSGSCGPAVCSMYVCVKPHVTSHWFFVLGVLFLLASLFSL